MPRRRNVGREGYWVDMLERHRASERSVAQFCQDEGVTVAAFWQLIMRIKLSRS